MAEVLEVRNLQVRRGKIPALFVEHLRISAGEVLAVVGPNGAGKSSLLLALARLITPTRGEVIYQGKSLAEWNDLEYRRQMAIVFQESLLVDRSVIDNVMLGMRFRHTPEEEARALAEKWLKMMNIEGLANRRATELSGGEAQRVSLARALALEPRLLLLDEPFSALDPPARTRLLEDLERALSRDHCTTVFVTHHLKEAARLGDRVAVLLNGKLRQVGKMEDLQTNPADEEVAEFVNSGE